MYHLAVVHDVERQSPKGVLRWAYATRSHCLQKYSPSDFTVDRYSDDDTHKGWRQFNGYDLLFVLDYALAGSYVSHARSAEFAGPIVVSFNKDHRSRHKEWIETLRVADFVVVNNVDRYLQGGIQPRTCCISNGLDLDHWRVTTPFADRPERAIWCGGTGVKKKKGYHDILMPLAPMLEAEGIKCEFRPVTDITPDQVLTPDEQLAWYNSARYVLCASETEGTPGYLLEAMACGCVPVSTYVGNVPEFALPQPPLVVQSRTPEAYRQAILSMRSHPSRDAQYWSDLVLEEIRQRWGYGPPASRADHFFSLFRRLIDDGPESVEPFIHWDVEPEDI